MSQPILRQLKLRSEEQQTLNKTYNKSTVIIPADALYSTDLSQSYLNLKLKIKTNKDKEITTADLLHLKSKDLSVSFGHGSLDYSPACLIKNCVLKRGDGAIIESIPFSNIISQSLYQFTNNKESVSNKSLLSGMCFESNALNGSMSSIVKNPIQIQIPLSDLFQSCQSSNWYMSETKGLIFDLEFEDKKNLMKLNKINSRLHKNEDYADATQNLLNLKPTIDFNDLLSFDDPEKFYFTEVDGTNVSTNLQAPKQIRIPTRELFNEPNLSKIEPNDPITPQNRTLEFNAENQNITLAELQAKGLDVDDYIKMIFKYKGDNITKNFVYYNKVAEFLPAVAEVPAQPAVLQYTKIGGKDVGGLVPTAWATDPDTYLLNGASSTDFTLDVFIDGTTGQYSIHNQSWVDISGKAGNPTYIIPKENLGAGNTVDLTIVITDRTSNPPVYTINDGSAGGAQPIPTATAGVPGNPTSLVLENSLFSDEPAKYEMVYIELLNGNLFTTYDKANDDFHAKIKENKLVVSETELTYLKSKGLVADDYRITDTCFDLVAQNEYLESADVNTDIVSGLISKVAPEIIVDNKTYSNGAFLLPNTGRKVKLNKITAIAGGKYELEFSNLNLADAFGFQFKGVNRASNTAKWGVSGLDAPRVKLGFVNFQKLTVALTDAELVAKIAEGLTYDIDLLEIVVQQQSKNKKLPMPKVYSSYSIEPFTIENNLFQMERQFNITQPNVYNVALLMPVGDSLISSCMDRNVFNYRFQINNISNTSTDLQLKSLVSDYPSSLHLDKQIDYFSNSTYQMKTMFGIKGLENVAVVPSILPLKIYSANDSNSFYTNPAGFSLQLAMASNEEAGQIKTGVCYLVKSCLKSL
tara:strand:- start:9552 stop:12146 length:2595 start_codon:yes stop_codon:yes gene_type:complete